MFILLLLLGALFNPEIVNAGNCCRAGPVVETNEQAIDLQPIVSNIETNEEYSSSADTEEKQAKELSREEFEREHAQEYIGESNKYLSRQERFPGEFDIIQQLQGDDEAGPSTALPQKVPVPDQTGIYMNIVLDIFSKNLEGNFKTAFDLIYNTNNMLNKIRNAFLKLRLEDDIFLEVVSNKIKDYCASWVLSEVNEEIIPRIRNIYINEGENISNRYSSDRIKMLNRRQESIRGKDIKMDKKNARNYCRIGAYLALCRILSGRIFVSENMTGEEKEIKNKLDQFIKLWKNGLDILPYKENNLIHSNKIRERLQTLKFRDLLNAMREVIQDEKKETKEGKRKMKQKEYSGN